MAVTRGTRTPLANISRIASDAAGKATAFGELTLGNEHAIDIYLNVTLNTSAANGTLDLYLVESQEGTEWTDGIDPSGSDTDWALYIFDAKLIASANAHYVTTTRASVSLHWAGQVAELQQYIGFVLVNNSGQAISGTAANGDSQTVTFS